MADPKQTWTDWTGDPAAAPATAKVTALRMNNIEDRIFGAQTQAESAIASAGIGPRVAGPGQAISAATTLVSGRHYVATATGAAFTVTLPTPSRSGEEISVKKGDGSANLVTISGSIDGATGTKTLLLQGESLLLMSGTDSSWYIVAGRAGDRAALDARYGVIA